MSLGIAAAVVSIVSGVTSTAIGVASAAGAFKPGNQALGGGAAPPGTETVSDAIQDANNQIDALTTQVNTDSTTISQLQTTTASQADMEYLALGLAGVAVAGGLFLFIRRKK